MHEQISVLTKSSTFSGHHSLKREKQREGEKTVCILNEGKLRVASGKMKTAAEVMVVGGGKAALIHWYWNTAVLYVALDIFAVMKSPLRMDVML